MIFVTVGTDAAPFDRLLRALSSLPGSEPVVAQCGSSSVRPARAQCIEFLDFDSLAEHVRSARAVVTHAGVGSIMVALANGKSPVVVPRRRRFSEAVDDHQYVLAKRLARDGFVTLVEDPELLSAALAGEQSHARSLDGGSGLALDIREYLGTHLGRPT